MNIFNCRFDYFFRAFRNILFFVFAEHENKYHKADEPFNPYRRMAYHGYEYDKSTELSDDEIKEGLGRLAEEIKNLPHPVAKAYAVKYVLGNTMTDINAHDYFVGLWSVNRLANDITVNRWNREVFEEKILPVKKKTDDFNAAGAVAMWPDFDHVVPDWDSVLSLGFSGLKKRAEEYRELHRKNNTLTPEKEAFFDGIIIEYTAIIDLTDRLFRQTLAQTHAKSAKIAECLCHIRDGAPRQKQYCFLL